MYIISRSGKSNAPVRRDEAQRRIRHHRLPDRRISDPRLSGAGHKALFGKGMIAGQKVIVAKPMTYMNLSGESVRELVNYYKVDPESELIVVLR